MKLVIEIPELDYECAKQRWMRGNDAHKMDYYISKGIPLDDVKAEIDKAQEPYKTSATYDEGVRFGLMLAYQIIDKYKAENEVKPNE